MVRRALLVLSAALGAACQSAAGFTETPHPAQLAALAAACVFAAALQAPQKKLAEMVAPGSSWQFP